MPYKDLGEIFSNSKDYSHPTEEELNQYFDESEGSLDIFVEVLSELGVNYSDTDTEIRVQYYIDVPEKRVNGREISSKRIDKWKVYKRNI
jgi:hypothetical protein